VWECKSAWRCAYRGIGKQIDGYVLINNISTTLEAPITISDEKERNGRVLPLWGECVIYYLKRNLGKANDRLPVISSIVVLLQPPNKLEEGGGGGGYLAGL